MDRAWANNAGANVPTTPPSFNIGYPTEGDPLTGTPATEPGLWWFHMITEELRNLVAGSGITPKAGALNQVYAAVIQIANAASVHAIGSLAALDPTAAAQLVAASANATAALSQAASAVSGAAAAIVAANNATATANAAQSDASTALGLLGTIASDNVLASVEKPAVILDYQNITNEQGGIDAQAVAFAITTERTAYDNAITALTAYLATLTAPTNWNNVTGSTNIVGTTFRATFATVYSTRQTLLNKISAVAKAAADTAQGNANTAIANAAAANSTANSAAAAAAAAVTTANAATAQLTAIADDNILSPQEKATVVQDYAAILAEQAGIDAQASSMSVSAAAYDTAISDLTAYLGGLSGWNVIPGANVTIVGTTFRGKFTAVYAAKQALLNAITGVAALMATWSQISGIAVGPGQIVPGTTHGTAAVSGVSLTLYNGAAVASVDVTSSLSVSYTRIASVEDCLAEFQTALTIFSDNVLRLYNINILYTATLNGTTTVAQWQTSDLRLLSGLTSYVLTFPSLAPIQAGVGGVITVTTRVQVSCLNSGTGSPQAAITRVNQTTNGAVFGFKS